MGDHVWAGACTARGLGGGDGHPDWEDDVVRECVWSLECGRSAGGRDWLGTTCRGGDCETKGERDCCGRPELRDARTATAGARASHGPSMAAAGAVVGEEWLQCVRDLDDGAHKVQICVLRSAAAWQGEAQTYQHRCQGLSS